MRVFKLTDQEHAELVASEQRLKDAYELVDVIRKEKDEFLKSLIKTYGVKSTYGISESNDFIVVDAGTYIKI